MCRVEFEREKDEIGTWGGFIIAANWSTGYIPRLEMLHNNKEKLGMYVVFCCACFRKFSLIIYEPESSSLKFIWCKLPDPSFLS